MVRRPKQKCIASAYGTPTWRWVWDDSMVDAIGPLKLCEVPR